MTSLWRFARSILCTLVCGALFVWWVHVRPAGAITIGKNPTHIMQGHVKHGVPDVLQINGVKFETRSVVSRHGIHRTLKSLLERCANKEGRAIPSHDGNHGFVVCYSLTHDGLLDVRLAYARGTEHAATVTEIWSQEPINIANPRPSPSSVSPPEGQNSMKLQAAGGDISLSVQASPMNASHLADQHKSQLKNAGWKVRTFTLDAGRFVLQATLGRRAKTLVISDHATWTSAITTFETPGVAL